MMIRSVVSIVALALVASAAPAVCVPVIQESPVTKAEEVHGYQIQENPVTKADEIVLDAFPSSYDLRTGGYVTSVKNQGGCGSCWAFATYGAMESNMLVAGDLSSDFSENHLKNYHGFDPGPCSGGNTWISTAYLGRLDGPVSEADDPYHAWDDRPSPGGPRQRFLRDANYYDTADEIKGAIMSTGGMYVSMRWESGSYRSSDATYYYGGGDDTNHGVTIVGWDDAKDTPATNDGAWLTKNSWGTGWGENGYFWISYDDTKACKYAATFETDPADTAADVYYHDFFGDVTEVNTPYACNVFETTNGEVLKSVGFFTQKDGAGFDLRIYADWDSEEDEPVTQLAQKTGTIDHYGFHVIDLDSTISLPAGDDFVVYLQITDGGEFPQAFDRALGGYSSASTANPGESFYSFNGVDWTDLTTFNTTANFSIKVYTIPEPGTIWLFLGFVLTAGLVQLVRWWRRK